MALLSVWLTNVHLPCLVLKLFAWDATFPMEFPFQLSLAIKQQSFMLMVSSNPTSTIIHNTTHKVIVSLGNSSYVKQRMIGSKKMLCLSLQIINTKTVIGTEYSSQNKTNLNSTCLNVMALSIRCNYNLN